MPYLVVVSLVWALSFGLIKGQLAGLDAAGVSAARVALSLVFFLPFLRLRGVPAGLALRFAAVGALQYGLMYLAYIQAFGYLMAHEVALFTIFTPVWVTAFENLLRRRFTPLFWATTVAAVLGTAVVKYRDLATPGLWTGFLLVQVSNAGFAVGQVAYRRLRERHPEPADRSVFALLYTGALAVTLPFAVLHWDGSFLALGAGQLGALVYLGVVASGLCFFWWNLGATRVDAGSLAVMNNLKVPLAVAASLLVFGEEADLPRLLVGGGIVLAALWIARRAARGQADPDEAARGQGAHGGANRTDAPDPAIGPRPAGG